MGSVFGKKSVLFSSFTLCAFFVTDVFIVDAERVIVMEGDSVTLHTGVEIAKEEDIKWYFNDIHIAQFNGDLSYNCTDVQCNKDNERFRDKLKLDSQTGSLTINDIRTEDSGEYELQILSSSKREKKFIVAVLQVSADDVDEVKAISVKEGESVTLNSGVIKQPCDVMMWYFNSTLITQDPITVCSSLQCKDGDDRFRDRLNLDNQTGSLTITDTRTTDSGEYTLKISCRVRSRISSRSGLKVFSVNVTGSALSSNVVAGICVGGVLLLLVFIACLICCYKHRKKAREKYITGTRKNLMQCRRRPKESTLKLSETTSTETANDESHNEHVVEDETL